MSDAQRTVQVGDLRLNYRELGAGPPVLLLHGWPTSSFLWRDVMPPIAAHSRVIAPDLPGFGQSEKPLDQRYSFGFFRDALDGFLAALRIDELSIAVHDLGGPIGLDWVVRHPERVRRLALLNTIVYPQVSWAVVAFLLAGRMPIVRDWLASPQGLEATMKIGMAQRHRLTPEVVAGVTDPFRTREARRALLKAGTELNPLGLAEIAKRLPSLRVPVRIVYGARDRILPDVARTMARVQRDLPQAQTTVLPHCGHFLQEDDPAQVGALLADFFAAESAGDAQLSGG